MPRVLVKGGLSEQKINAYTYIPIPKAFALLLPLIVQKSTFTIPYNRCTQHMNMYEPNLYLLCF